MSEELSSAVKAKITHIETYFDVTPETQPNLDAFAGKLNKYAEQFSDVASFEQAFVSDPLYTEYCAFYTTLKPKPYQMTKEDKDFARQTAKNMFAENKNDIIADILDDAASTAIQHLKSEAITKHRNDMIEDGVFDDYTRATNKIDDAKRTGTFLGKLFKKTSD